MKNKDFSPKEDGKLIVFEGISGSGKGTQIDLLQRAFDKKEKKVLVTHWNSDEIASKLISLLKKNRAFTPMSWCIAHATDFSVRYYEKILPALQEGYIVIVDRYYYTAITRDTTRGVAIDYIKNLYSFARIPDLTVFIDVTPETAFHRRVNRHSNFYYYSSGGDLNLSEDLKESFSFYNTLIRRSYFEHFDRENVELISGEGEINSIFDDIKRVVNKKLSIVL